MFQGDDFGDFTGVKRTRAGDVAGGVGSWGLHLAAVLFMAYSAYHGINASAQYRSAAGLGMAAGIVGIVVIEIVILSIYLAWHNSKIVGAPQSVAAAVTFGLGFTLASLGILADSQLNAGRVLSPWLEAYLIWGLPLAPVPMALGAVLIHELAPDRLRARRESEDRDMLDDLRFSGYLDGIKAQIAAERAAQSMQLAAKTQAAKQIAAWYSSDQAQRAITATALKDAPRLLRQIGIDVDQVAPPAVDQAAPADRQWIPEIAELIAEGKVPAPPPLYQNGNGNGGAAAGRGGFHGDQQ